jgi:hypothetical protein
LIVKRDVAKRKRSVAVAAAAILAETAGVWLRSGRPGGELAVRCRDGHVFTTLWIPGVSLKALRLGPWRFQHCPVGHHWSVVTPVNASKLSRAQQRSAREHHDVRLP